MSTIRPLPFHVFDELHVLRARVGTLDDALNVVAWFRDGAHVQTYHRNAPAVTLWTVGTDNAQSVALAVETMKRRAENAKRWRP